MTTDTTTDTASTDRETAVFVGGPQEGWRLFARAGHRWALYRGDDGEPIKASTGSTEFCFRPLNGKPSRRHYCLQTGYGEAAYVHASLFPLWQEASSDVRHAVLRHRRPTPVVVAAQRQGGDVDPVPGLGDRTGPARPHLGVAA